MPWHKLGKDEATPIDVSTAVPTLQATVPTVASNAARDALFSVGQRPLFYRVRNTQTGYQEVWAGPQTGWVQEFALDQPEEPGEPDPSDLLAGEPYLVVVTPNPLRVRTGSAKALTVTVLDVFGNPTATGALLWLVSSLTQAAVNSSNELVGATPGDTTVRARVTWVRQGESAPRTATSAAVPVTVTGPIATISVTPNPLPVEEDQAAYPVAVALDAGGRSVPDVEFEWESADPAIGLVNASGEVVGMAPGVTDITATAEGITGSAEVHVTGALDSVLLGPDPLDTFTAPGQTAQLVPVARDSALNSIPGVTFTYETSDPQVLTVSPSGLVTSGLKRGSATITVRAQSGVIEVEDTLAGTTDYEVLLKYVAGVTDPGSIGMVVERDYLGGAASVNTPRFEVVGGDTHLKIYADGADDGAGTYERVAVPLYNAPGLNEPFTILFEFATTRAWLEAERMGMLFAMGRADGGSLGRIEAHGSPDEVYTFSTVAGPTGAIKTGFARPEAVAPVLYDRFTCRIEFWSDETGVRQLHYWSKNGGAETSGWTGTPTHDQAAWDAFTSWGAAIDQWLRFGYTLVDIGAATPILLRRFVWRRGQHSLAVMQAT